MIKSTYFKNAVDLFEFVFKLLYFWQPCFLFSSVPLVLLVDFAKLIHHFLDVAVELVGRLQGVEVF